MDDNTKTLSSLAAVQAVVMALTETHPDKEALDKSIVKISNHLKSTFDYSPIDDEYIQNFESQIQLMRDFLADSE